MCPAGESMEEIREKYAQERISDEPLEDFISRWYGYKYNKDLDECGYLCNPNAKWDWYEIGGRWSNLLRLKPVRNGNHSKQSSNKDAPAVEGRCNQARLSDVDLSIDQAAYERAARFWEVVVEGDALCEHENADDFKASYRKEYYIDQFGDKHTYAMDSASFSTWALVTPDGKWIENGAVGWFGMHTATRSSRRAFADELKAALEGDPGLWLTIVDCHI